MQMQVESEARDQGQNIEELHATWRAKCAENILAVLAVAELAVEHDKTESAYLNEKARIADAAADAAAHRLICAPGSTPFDLLSKLEVLEADVIESLLGSYRFNRRELDIIGAIKADILRLANCWTRIKVDDSLV